MTREFTIDGRRIAFAVSAAVPRLYRVQCGRDIFRDIAEVARAVSARLEGESDAVPVETLTVFENLAYAMAYAADPQGTPESVEAWLDTMPALPIMEIFPKIELLWLQNLATLNEPVKK